MIFEKKSNCDKSILCMYYVSSKICHLPPYAYQFSDYIFTVKSPDWKPRLFSYHNLFIDMNINNAVSQ